MRPFALFSLAICLLSPLQPQTVSSIHISTEPPGPKFFVDGNLYTEVASFFWPAGSRHVANIEEPVQEYTSLGARYTFTGWTDSSGKLSTSGARVEFTADPSVWYLTARFQVEYAVALNFFACREPDLSLCGDLPGTVYVNGAPHARNTTVWLPRGFTVTLRAEANSGFAFTGWGITQGHNKSPELSFVLEGPRHFYPGFEPSVGVTLQTSPPGLRVLVDRAPMATPAAFDWARGAGHTLGPVSPQTDAEGGHWVFESWSHGAEEHHTYTVPTTNYPQTLTAHYAPGARASFLTVPSGLKLNVDGWENWPTYNFVWGVGSTHTVSAPLEQTDRDGRRYVFRGWSNGGDAEQELTIPEEAATSGLRMVATYERLGKLTIESTPLPLNILLDGAECSTPCTIHGPAGQSVAIGAPGAHWLSESTRLDFSSWSDGAGQERTWTFEDVPATITAAYQVRHRLRAVSEPTAGAAFRLDPVSEDGFYPAGERVSVFADALPGHRFRFWKGDANGIFQPGVVTMSEPRTLIAMLEEIPHIVPAGVGNAAAATPEPGVAPGSVISIYGASLAPALEVGPSSPLAQTIAGVTVHLGNRLLPLFFVSPEQINAQLPSDVAEGVHELTVRREAHPAVSAEFLVVRHAPGLFMHTVGSFAFVAATREDGTLVSAESPARRGELITLYGTGLGPYVLRPPDGFATPEEPAFPLANPVEILIGESAHEPEWAGAAPGYVGVTAIRFRIPQEGLVSAAALKVRIGERDSNTVFLAVE